VNGCNSRSSYKLGVFFLAWFAGSLLFFGTVLITSPGREGAAHQHQPTGRDAPGRPATTFLVE